MPSSPAWWTCCRSCAAPSILPEFGFTYSIKSVAPALCPGFGYDDLEDIADGAAASAAFLRFTSGYVTVPEEADRLRAALLAYCRRDTLAMVRVHRALMGLASNESSWGKSGYPEGSGRERRARPAPEGARARGEGGATRRRRRRGEGTQQGNQGAEGGTLKGTAGGGGIGTGSALPFDQGVTERETEGRDREGDIRSGQVGLGWSQAEGDIRSGQLGLGWSQAEGDIRSGQLGSQRRRSYTCSS